jgi:hypothetical protein
MRSSTVRTDVTGKPLPVRSIASRMAGTIDAVSVCALITKVGLPERVVSSKESLGKRLVDDRLWQYERLS